MNVYAQNTEPKLIPFTLPYYISFLVYCPVVSASLNYTIRQPIKTDRIDPSRAPTKSALKFVGFLGISAGFMLAYQRSSCECLFC